MLTSEEVQQNLIYRNGGYNCAEIYGDCKLLAARSTAKRLCVQSASFEHVYKYCFHVAVANLTGSGDCCAKNAVRILRVC